MATRVENHLPYGNPGIPYLNLWHIVQIDRLEIPNWLQMLQTEHQYWQFCEFWSLRGIR